MTLPPPDGTELSAKFTVRGELTDLNIAIGKPDADDVAVNVPTFQFDIRTSEGCIVEILSALRKPRGVPSIVPIWNSVPAAGELPDSDVVVVPPADTVTVFVDPTASSPAYNLAV